MSVRGGAWSIAAVMACGLLACSNATALENPPSPTPGTVDPAPLPDTGQGTGPTTPAPPADGGQARWIPAPGTTWQIQFSGAMDMDVNAEAIDLDLFDTPQSVIDALKARNRKVICYFSAGSYEDWRPDSGEFPPKALGAALDGWPGEQWLDVRSPELIELMKRRMDLAVQKGCDAVDLDNMDGFTNNTGFPLEANDQLHYNQTLAAEAHQRGLSIGLKNDLLQVQDLVEHFDFQINEQCHVYNECHMLLPFIEAGKAVFNIEYTGNQADVCASANAMNFDTLFKNRELDAARTPCR
ncbi:endo alpha-1,4 polygalactosaminidase [Corallococcus sp. CA054B]|uniref:endo alpha-1,4 polygalactosaminidase n=1 Tax=Corallococcus sp. CA054B TaxID=2316734 RepID=UPI001F2D7CD1|nr:endo alpha-1,4 polygalactosaminidase [Corallococcus sp. CA054B]